MMRVLLRKLRARLSTSESKPREIISPIGEPFTTTLCSMYDGSPQLGVDAKMYPLAENVGIGPQQGMLIYQFVRDTKPENTLEVGLAYGFSTVYFLAAIHANGKGHHVAVDPFQDDWSGIGVAREKVLGCQPGTFEFSDQTPVQALARFARERRRFGLIFIDSDHKFDGVLVDFTLAALICEPGGHIILDDMHMPAIQRAVAFIRLNRADFTELPTADKRLSIFRMTDTDQRKWDHFVPF